MAFSFWLSAVLILTLCLNVVGIVYAQTQEKPRTFIDCYSDLTKVPSESIPIIKTVLSDPKMKLLITNICNFYHDKTGIWFQGDGKDPKYPAFNQEFVQKYGNTFPDWMKQLIKLN